MFLNIQEYWTQPDWDHMKYDVWQRENKIHVLSSAV